MSYLGRFTAGDSVFYSADFHSDQGTLVDPTSSTARLRSPAGVWSDLDAPTKQDTKTGFYGGMIDTTGFASGQWTVRIAGTVATAKNVALERYFHVGPAPSNLVALGGAAQSATDLKDFADAGYDPATHKLEEVKVLTGHTAQTGDSFARLGNPAGASVSADVAAVKADSAAILTDTADMQPKLGTPAVSVSADLAAIQADTNDLQTQIGAAGAGLTAISQYIDTEVAAIKAKTDNLPADPADESSVQATLATLASYLAVRSATAQAGGVNTITLDAGASGINDYYLNQPILLLSGAGVGQSRRITAYNGVTKVATLESDWASQPNATTVFAILPGSAAALSPTERAAIADKLLGRNLAGSSDGGRTVTSALRSVRNKVDTVSVPGSAIVYQEDDVTEDHRRALTTDASALPIVTADPTT